MPVALFAFVLWYIIEGIVGPHYARPLSSISLPAWVGMTYLVLLSAHALDELGVVGVSLRQFLNRDYYGTHPGPVSARKGAIDAIGAYFISGVFTLLALTHHAAWILGAAGKDAADMVQHFVQWRILRRRDQDHEPGVGWKPAHPLLGASFFWTTVPATLFVFGWLLYEKHALSYHGGAWWWLAAAAAAGLGLNTLYIARKASR